MNHISAEKKHFQKKYDNMYVYGIGMERISDHKKRMVLVLSDNPRQN
ncbi:MAG: hypothetical protein ACLR7D_03710 [Lachnospira eligens]